MSSAKERRQARRAAKKQAFEKATLEAYGLPWIDNDSRREACFQSGADAAKEVIDQKGLADMAVFVKEFAKGIANPLGFVKFIREYNASDETKLAIEAAFKSAYLECFDRTREEPAPAPRKQVDIGTVGSKLPAQTIGMMKPKTDPEAWKAWVVPAIGLVAAFILWRRK
jgi:hypothetical protein